MGNTITPIPLSYLNDTIDVLIPVRRPSTRNRHPPPFPPRRPLHDDNQPTGVSEPS